MAGTVTNFEDLEAWQEARKLVRLIYQMTSQAPFNKDFALRDQIQRSAISVMANIAEGFETASDPEFVQFLRYSLRSCSEVRSHLYTAFDISYINESASREVSQQALKTSNFIKALIKYLRSAQSD